MKTFYEHFLQVVQEKLEKGEIDEEDAERWVKQLNEQLSQFPGHPLTEMPTRH